MFKKVDDPKEYLALFAKMDRLGRLIGLNPKSVSEKECVFEYTVLPEHFNPNGILHGGALYSAMDSCQGAFIHFILTKNFKGAATGTSTIKYLSPVTRGLITIKTWLKEIQGRKYFISSNAVDESGLELATLEEIWIALKHD